MMRVDMVAVALALGGLCLVMLALRRPALIYLAVVAFVGAVFTKQTMLAAPGAAFLVLLPLRPGLAIRGIAGCVVLGLIVLGGLTLATHGQFTQHIFGYNINRFSLARLLDAKHLVRVHVLYLLLGAVGMWLSWRRLIVGKAAESAIEIRDRLSADVAATRLLIAMAYLAAASCFLILVGKVGSGINYYVEWFLALSVFVGVSLRPAADIVFSRSAESGPAVARFNPLLVIPALIAIGALMAPPADKYDGITSAEDQAQLATLTRWIAAADRPVISDNMVILREAGKEVVLEPAIVAELGSNGIYDQGPFIRMIHNRDFAFFVTYGGRGVDIFDQRYNPAVAAAIYQDYPRIEHVGGFVVHLPAAAGPGLPRP
jgi:hypothetical protein